MTILDPTQVYEACEKGRNQEAKAPKRYKVIATAEFINYKPAHERWITKQGEGSSIRTACKDAIDNILSTPKAKAIRNKLPFKVVFQEGGE